jgi:hypothetical protein
MLGLLSDPVYVYLSRGGEVFVPAIDTTAFPPRQPIGRVTRQVQRITQQIFGLHPAPGGERAAHRPGRSVEGQLAGGVVH